MGSHTVCRMCVKTIRYKRFLNLKNAEQDVVYPKHYVDVYYQLRRYFHYKSCVNYIDIQVMSSSKTRSLHDKFVLVPMVQTALPVHNMKAFEEVDV